MAALTVDTTELIGSPVAVAVSAVLTDVNGDRIDGTGNGIRTPGVTTRTGYDGLVTLDLETRLDVVPVDSYWTVTVGPWSWLIVKSDRPETLLQAAVYPGCFHFADDFSGPLVEPWIEYGSLAAVDEGALMANAGPSGAAVVDAETPSVTLTAVLAEIPDDGLLALSIGYDPVMQESAGQLYVFALPEWVGQDSDANLYFGPTAAPGDEARLIDDGSTVTASVNGVVFADWPSTGSGVMTHGFSGIGGAVDSGPVWASFGCTAEGC